MKKFLTCLFVLLKGLSLFAAENPRLLTIDDAVKMALENNISIERNQITLRGLERAKNHSWNSVSPSISVGAQAGVPVDALSDSESKYSAKIDLSASLSLSLTANLYTSVQTAKLNYELGKLSFDDAVRSVELSVRQTFYGLLYEKENISVQEKNLSTLRTQYSSNASKYNAGRLSEIDLLSSEVSYKNQIPTVESANTAYLNDLASFKQLLGLEQSAEIELSGNLDEMIRLEEISLDGIEISSSKIKNLEKKIEAGKNAVLSARFSAYAPSLNASVKFSDGSWYTGYDGTAPDATKSTSLTLSASIPLDGILPWSSKSDSIASAKDSLEDYELQLKNARTDLQLSVDSVLRSIKQSQSAIKSKQANVNLAQRSYNLTWNAYTHGTKDYLAVQTSLNSLLSAQLSLKNEIYNLIKSILSLENTIGVKFGTFSAKK